MGNKVEWERVTSREGLPLDSWEVKDETGMGRALVILHI